jgi:hypothetical protein
MAQGGRAPSPWSHEGLERRGYKKCPYCWRHLVKIDEHIAAHKAGRIGPDGRRRVRGERSARRGSARRPAFRVGAAPVTAGRRVFVGAADVNRILALTPPDRTFFRDVDGAVDQEP